MTVSSQAHTSTLPRGARVCMHVLGTARTDERVMREATALAQAGLDVTIVDVEKDDTRPRQEDFRGVHLTHVVMPSRFRRSRVKLWAMVRILGMMVRCAFAVARTTADIYHAHDDMAFFACYAAAVLRRRRLILDAHELPLVQTNLVKLRTVNWAANAFLRRTLPRVSGVITVSAPIAREIQRRYGGPYPVLVRNVPVYHPPMTKGAELREALGAPPDTRLALYQGGIQENRSLDVLVRAARFLAPGNIIVLLGKGDQQPQLEALIQSERVEERVRIIPSVPYADLLRWTASADLGLILYRGSYSLNVQFCLPNKLFEYMMAGTPVLASSLDAVTEILTASGAGRVVESLAPEAVGAAINELLADESARERMGRNGLGAARQEFRWDIEQERLLALYASVLPNMARTRMAQAEGRARA